MSGAYYYLVKVVASFKYYWNVDNSRWEGLKDNATLMKFSFANALKKRGKDRSLQVEYSHTK